MVEERRPIQVFLCHASADKQEVRELYRYLRKRGIKPWFDEVDLIGGQDWQVEIPKALANSDAIIICLTKNSVDKEGYIQKEIKFALDKALEMPEGRIFLIPIRFEECEVPFSLSRYQWVDLFDEMGHSRMMKALKYRASQLDRANVKMSQTSKEEEKLALEKAVREKAEREAAELAARQNAEQEAAEKTAQERREREAAERVEKEKAKREAAERAKRERNEQEAAREKAKTDSAEKAKRQNGEHRKALIMPIIGIFGIIVILFFGGVLAASKIIGMIPNVNASLTPTQTATKFLENTSAQSTVTKTLQPNSTPTASQTPAPTSLPKQITDTEGLQMVLILAGEFSMGGEEEYGAQPYELPKHQVYLDSYYIDKYEVTNASYKNCVDSGDCQLPKIPSKGANYYYNPEKTNHPVVYIDWYMANTYCEWRNARLPSEAEWEKAASRNSSVRPWADYLKEVGVVESLNGEYDRSEYDVFDTRYNVTEWVSSLYKPYPYSATDGREDLNTSGMRVLRGGNFTKNPYPYFVSYWSRYSNQPSFLAAYVGFRCARDGTP